MEPPKWRQFWEGGAGGASSRTGLTLPQSSLPFAISSAVAVETEFFAVESGREKVPFSGREHGGSGDAVVLADR
jgi:hypothetical protein